MSTLASLSTSAVALRFLAASTTVRLLLSRDVLRRTRAHAALADQRVCGGVDRQITRCDADQPDGAAPPADAVRAERNVRTSPSETVRSTSPSMDSIVTLIE